MSTSLDDAPLAQPGAASALAALDRMSPLRVLVASLLSCRSLRARASFHSYSAARCACASLRSNQLQSLAALAHSLRSLNQACSSLAALAQNISQRARTRSLRSHHCY